MKTKCWIFSSPDGIEEEEDGEVEEAGGVVVCVGAVDEVGGWEVVAGLVERVAAGAQAPASKLSTNTMASARNLLNFRLSTRPPYSFLDI